MQWNGINWSHSIIFSSNCLSSSFKGGPNCPLRRFLVRASPWHTLSQNRGSHMPIEIEGAFVFAPTAGTEKAVP